MLINKNFSKLLFGRTLLNMGDSLYYITLMWMVYDLTGNTLYTGIAGALFMLPEAFSLFYGPIIDKANKKHLLIIFSFLQSIFILILLLLYTTNISVYYILLIIPFLAFCSEFTYPLGSTLIPIFVKKKELPKANSLMSVADDGIDLFFNAISGVLIAITSIYAILVGNLIIFVVAGFFFITLRYKSPSLEEPEIADNNNNNNNNTYKSDLISGIKFVLRKDILEIIIPFVILNILLASLTVNFPAISQESFQSSTSYGLLLTASGLGSVLGAIISNYISKKFKFGLIMIGTIIMYGVFWFIGLISGGHFIYIFAFLASISIGIINVVFAVLFQQLPPVNMIGRVGTAISTIITFFMPIGALLGGIAPQILGVKIASLVIVSIIVLLGLSLFFIKSIRLKSYISEQK